MPTITEALAEIKTIAKRMEKKRAAILPFLARQDGIKDPLERDGGSEAFITAERQSLADLGSRVIALRSGIQQANESNSITIGTTTRSIAEWLIWRRDVASGEGQFLSQLRTQLNSIRQQAQKSGAGFVVPGAQPSAPTDFIINISEADLSRAIEQHEEILGTLDGQLSLKNATVLINL